LTCHTLTRIKPRKSKILQTEPRMKHGFGADRGSARASPSR